jgi:hypothetical protein
MNVKLLLPRDTAHHPNFITKYTLHHEYIPKRQCQNNTNMALRKTECQTGLSYSPAEASCEHLTASATKFIQLIEGLINYYTL